MAEIQLKHVYKKYEDKVVAVQDFNLKIKDQEFVIVSELCTVPAYDRI